MSQWVIGVRHTSTPELSQQGYWSKVHSDGDLIWYLREDGAWGNMKRDLRKFESEELAQAAAFAAMFQWPETICAFVVERIE